jgi:hypothetical protein
VPGNRHANATPYGAYNYGLRDIVELIYRSPDKAKLRTAHGSLAPGWGGGGDEFLFKLLKDLRGRLVHATTDDLDVWPAVGVEGDKLVVVLYNDHAAPRTVSLTVDAPKGTTLAGATKTWVEPKVAKGPLAFHSKTIDAAGRQFTGRIALRQQSGAKLVFQLEGKVAAGPRVLRRQTFAKGVLNKVDAGKDVTLVLRLDPQARMKADTAVVKVALEGVDGDEVVLAVNGQPVVVPPSRNWLTEIPVDVKLLKASNALKFTSIGDGYQVNVASIVLDTLTP